MVRNRPPNRRPSRIRRVVHNDLNYDVGLSFDPKTLTITEVFITSHTREGSSVRNTSHDVAILLSLLIQYGATPAGIAHSLLVIGGDTTIMDNQPASIIGAIVAEMVAFEGEKS